MCIKKDYEPLTLAMKLVVLENFLITLPAIVFGMIFKDLVVFQKSSLWEILFLLPYLT